MITTASEHQVDKGRADGRRQRDTLSSGVCSVKELDGKCGLYAKGNDRGRTARSASMAPRRDRDLLHP